MLSTLVAQDPPVALSPRVWHDTRWVGSIAGHATTPDLLAGATGSGDQKRFITRIDAAACADLLTWPAAVRVSGMCSALGRS